jgi:hypothetical protein
MQCLRATEQQNSNTAKQQSNKATKQQNHKTTLTLKQQQNTPLKYSSRQRRIGVSHGGEHGARGGHLVSGPRGGAEARSDDKHPGQHLHAAGNDQDI